MARYVARKVLHAIAVLLIVSFALAFLLDLTPGDPADAILGAGGTPEQIAEVHEALGLDDPLHERYWRWLSDVVQLDFGRSYVTGESVNDLIAQRVPVTLELTIIALLIALSVSIPVGVYTAYHADGRFDRFWSAFTSLKIAIPVFVVAQLLIYIFALKLRVFPATGWTPLDEDVGENLRGIALPALSLALIEMPAFTRLLRADMIQTLQEDYVLAARAKGLPNRRILFRHALRPSSFSLMTMAGLSLGRLLGAAVIVEIIFSFPGVGRMIAEDIYTKDILAVQGVVMFVAIFFVLLNSFIDILYRMLDPRLRARTV